jgi:hypothetical protein
MIMTIYLEAKETGIKSLFAYASGITTPLTVVSSEIAKRITRGTLKSIGDFTANLFGINGHLIQRIGSKSGLLNNIKYYTALSTLTAINITSLFVSVWASQAIGQKFDPSYELSSFEVKFLLARLVYDIAARNFRMPQTSSEIKLNLDFSK